MGKVTSKDGTGIAFDRSGQGPALILVDGAFCYRGFGPMGPLSERLAPHFTVYKYDRRGRGESGDTPPYAVEREVEDLQALINEAGGQAFVYGISSGAALSLDAAAAFPGIKKLAVYEPPFMVDDSHPLPPANLPEQLYELVSEDLRGDAVELFMVKGIGMPPESVAPMRHAPVWSMFEGIAPTLAYDATIMGDSDWLPPRQLASVMVPTLAMAGGASPAWARSSVQALKDLLPNAQIRILEGQTHEVASEALAPVLVEFFK